MKESRKKKGNLLNENDKENYQNFLEEILNQYEQQDDGGPTQDIVRQAEDHVKRHHNSRGRYHSDYE